MSNGSEHIPEASTLDGATTEPEPGVANCHPTRAPRKNAA